MMPNLGYTGLGFQGCVPGTAIRWVETVGFTWLGIRKACIDELRVRNAMNELGRSQRSPSTFLADQPSACCPLDLSQKRHLIVVID